MIQIPEILRQQFAAHMQFRMHQDPIRVVRLRPFITDTKSKRDEQ
jgi:hypothetical protein